MTDDFDGPPEFYDPEIPIQRSLLEAICREFRKCLPTLDLDDQALLNIEAALHESYNPPPASPKPRLTVVEPGPVARVQVMGSVNRVPVLGCLIDVGVALKVGDPLYARPLSSK